MSDFKSRLETEKAQLEEMIRQLDVFLCTENSAKIDPMQIALAYCQIQAIRTCHRILQERIIWLSTPPESEP